MNTHSHHIRLCLVHLPTDLHCETYPRNCQCNCSCLLQSADYRHSTWRFPLLLVEVQNFHHCSMPLPQVLSVCLSLAFAVMTFSLSEVGTDTFCLAQELCKCTFGHKTILQGRHHLQVISYIVGLKQQDCFP